LDPDEIVRMLVVDDDPGAADLYRRLLEKRMNIEVERAVDAASARRKLTDSEFDVVTIDYRLPDESGLVLLEDLVEGEDNPPAIVVTAYGDVHLATRSFELGAAGYVIKDFKLPDTLAAVVEKALAGAALKRASDELNRENAFTGVAVNALDEVFFVLDLEGRLMSWNLRLKELTGFTDGELHRMDFADICGASEARRLLETVAQQKSEKVVLRLFLTSRDGRRVPYELTAVTLKDAAGEPVGTCAIGQEVSWHRRVSSREVRDRDVADLTGDIIARVDFDGNFTLLSEAACRFWGYRRDELLGRSFTELMHPDDLEGGVEVSSSTLRAGRMVRGMVNRQLTKRGERHVEWNVMPLLGEDGSIEGFQFTGRDITDKVLTEQFLVQVNRELDAYAHTVSHDLKGPLSAIMLASDTLRMLLESQDPAGSPNGTLSEMAAIISKYTAEAGTLVEDLLVLAEAGQVPMDVEEVEVGEVVSEILDELDAVIAEKGVRVVLSDDLGRIWASRVQVMQVFSNLIANAVLHNDSSEPVVEVTYLGSEDGGHRYVVRDNGSGIPDGRLKDVFKLFYKGEDGGAGVGLATVEKVVQVYDGFIRAYNDQGACFEFMMKDHGRPAG
jgi:PAS domain S-box-containing protein